MVVPVAGQRNPGGRVKLMFMGDNLELVLVVLKLRCLLDLNRNYLILCWVYGSEAQRFLSIYL